LGISAPQPLYVRQKDASQNALIVATRDELGQRSLLARDVNWLAGSPPSGPIPAQVKIRYKAQGVAAMVESLGNGRVRVQFQEPVFGVTAGQGAVFYDGEICLGGGTIKGGTT
jgi:tRNA-specific 2-thiouridylase